MEKFDIRSLSLKKRVLLIALLVFLICSSVASATFAWLWSQSDQITNTFTGSNLDVIAAEDNWEYDMMPNTPVAKNPTATIAGGSEPAYLFMKPNESAKLSNYIDYYIHSDWQQYGSFVVDGELDSYYKQLEGWYFNSTRSDYPGLEAYYSEASHHSGSVTNAYYNQNPTFAETYQPLADVLQNGADPAKAQHAMELWVAYDHDYVYLFAKIYDNDYHENRGTFIGANNADYFAVYWDPDPKSRENIDYSQYPDIFTEGVLASNSHQNLTYHKLVPTQGEAEVKFFPADERSKVNGIDAACGSAEKKPGYGRNSMYDYFYSRNDCKNAENPNAVFFEFYGDINGDAANTLGGYGYEIRLPRNNSYYDTINGNPYFNLSAAATSYHAEYENKQMTLAFGQAYWLWYSNMLSFELNDENNPFVNETGIYYKVIGDEDSELSDNLVAEDYTFPILRSGACYGDEYSDGHVFVKSTVTQEMLQSADTNGDVTLTFNLCAIQKAHMDLELAYSEASKILNGNQ